jgi:D-sedoheptulose 7-phosphate isomerase
MDTRAVFEARIAASISLKQQLLADDEMLGTLVAIADVVVESFRTGGKTLFCGNGGSAADAQHLAAELSGRYYLDRPPLFAEALHVNTSYLTAVANDHDYGEIYCRLVRGMGQSGDVLVGMSTSGSAENVVRAVSAANELGMTTVAFTGHSGGQLKNLARYTVRIPSSDTPRIQECHMLLGHTLCELVEARLFPLPS